MSEIEGRLTGKVAIVTGAAQGIGRSYAVALAKAGARVCASDIFPPTETLATIEQAGLQAIAVEADVSSESSLEAMVAAARLAYGRLDILVNNAGIFSSLSMKAFDTIAVDEWDRVMAVNVKGTWLAIKAAAPLMRESGGGKIINISSATTFKGTPFLLHYVASKGAVIALTRSVARELASSGICVNAIAPGLVMSEGVQGHRDWQDAAAAIVASRAIKRDALPDDLIGALLFLSSDDSNFITGQTLVVDGGVVMH